MGSDPKRVQAVFLEAVELPPADRAAILDRACGTDAELRQRVQALLRAHEEPGSFLERPAVDDAVTGDRSAGGGNTGGSGELGSRECVGSRIGPYKLLEQIGEGGMGAVWMAEQQEPVRRRVALKVIKAGMDSAQVVARFEAERQALALMDHPHIAKVLDAATTPAGRPYFVMELVKGIPITKYCDERRLTPAQRVELFVPVCQAIQHAHQKGIIHRDVKPSNVLVASYDGQPVPKVIDFGVAKATGQRLTERTLVTGFGSLVGTLEYMSPEQAEFNALDVDTRSDIYSLGVLLYELLTGTTPLTKQRLKETALAEVLRTIREVEPPRPSTRLSASRDSLVSISAQRHMEPAKLTKLVRGELDWIVMKALEKDRTRRYQTANGLARDLERYLADEPVEACPPSAAYRLRKFARKNRRLLAASGAFLGLLVLAVIGLVIGLVAVNREQQKTRTALEAERTAKAQAREALDALTNDVVETMFAKQPELGETEKAFLRKVLGFYDAFTQQSAETAEARFLRAKGYFTVARLRGLLGEHRDAVAGYRQAEVLLEQLADEFPDASEYRHKLARTEGHMGIDLATLGKEADAETAFRRGVVLRAKLVDDFPGDLGYRLELANSYNDLGFLRELQLNYAEAEENYRRALDLKERLVADAGAESKYHRELAITLSNMGQLLRKQEKYAESEKLYRQALKLQQEHLDKGVPAAKDRKWLANSYSGLGIALAELGQPEEAQTAFRRALELRKKLTDDFPGILAYRRELANVYNSLAYLLTRQKKDAEAEEPYRQVVELRKGIVAQAGAVPRYRQELAMSYHDLAWVQSVTGRPEEAESAWRASLELWQQLAVDLPQVPDYQDGLAGALTNLAKLHNQRGEFAAAVRLLEKARSHSQAALNAQPKRPRFRKSFRDHLMALAESRLGLADHARLATTADELARFGFEPANDSYEAASMLCRCARLADKDKGLAEAKELAQSYADHALALLHRAQAAEFFNDRAKVEHLKKDTDFDVLRSREDFKKFVAELEASAKP